MHPLRLDGPTGSGWSKNPPSIIPQQCTMVIWTYCGRFRKSIYSNFQLDQFTWFPFSFYAATPLIVPTRTAVEWPFAGSWCLGENPMEKTRGIRLPQCCMLIAILRGKLIHVRVLSLCTLSLTTRSGTCCCSMLAETDWQRRVKG